MLLLYFLKEGDSIEEIEKVVVKENVVNNRSNESDENIMYLIDYFNEEDKLNFLVDFVIEFKNMVEDDESYEDMEDLNVLVNCIDDNVFFFLFEEKIIIKFYLKEYSSFSELMEYFFVLFEEDNDRVVRFWNLEENKLMRSGNYEFKDFYDYNKEIEDDEDMY